MQSVALPTIGVPISSRRKHLGVPDEWQSTMSIICSAVTCRPLIGDPKEGGSRHSRPSHNVYPSDRPAGKGRRRTTQRCWIRTPRRNVVLGQRGRGGRGENATSRSVCDPLVVSGDRHTSRKRLLPLSRPSTASLCRHVASAGFRSGWWWSTGRGVGGN
jgi:hypothetical protein